MQLNEQAYINGILAGNITILSKAITLVESALPKHQELAAKVLAMCLPYTGNAIRVGITGVPGVGKSSFIEKFGLPLINQHQKKVAVLAIDPSSKSTHGSILGDKTRMEQLAINANAFIRPTPSSNALGGVALKTRETILLCEAAGFDVILVETVGVGQSETAVSNMVDFFLLLMLAGAGDELQGIKRGIMEMADALVVTKADGDNLIKAKAAASEYKMAMHLLPPQEWGWIRETTICSALKNQGMDEVWQIVQKFLTHAKLKEQFNQKRKKQVGFWFDEKVHAQFMMILLQDPKVQQAYQKFKLLAENNQANLHQSVTDFLNSILNKD